MNDEKKILNETEDIVNVLIIALEDMNELQKDFMVKDSGISIKELKTKGNEIKKIIKKFKSQINFLPEDYIKSFKNIEYINEEIIGDAITECILYENSEQTEEVIHNMCYALREFVKQFDT